MTSIKRNCVEGVCRESNDDADVHLQCWHHRFLLLYDEAAVQQGDSLGGAMARHFTDDIAQGAALCHLSHLDTVSHEGMKVMGYDVICRDDVERRNDLLQRIAGHMSRF